MTTPKALWLALGLILGGAQGILAPSAYAEILKADGVVFREPFDHWRDQSTDPGFNTSVQASGSSLRITALNAAFGHAMSKPDPITINITKKTEMSLMVDRLDLGAIATVRLMSAYEPYDSYQVARIQNKLGEYRGSLTELTGWQGLTSFWIEVWVEGDQKSITLKDIYFRDANVMEKQKKQMALQQYTSKKFGDVPANSLFFEDFRKGVNGWRTAETDPGFSTELNFEAGYPRLTLQTGKGYGKVLSPADGIELEITSSAEIEIELTDVGKSQVKVELMTAHAPFDAHQVIAWVSEAGVYSANISQKTKWIGPKTFWIQLWIENTSRTESERYGVGIKYIKITDPTHLTQK